MPSMSRCGSHHTSSRSLHVPGSLSSQFTTMWTFFESFGTKPHFVPVENPAPPRPRRFEAFTSFTIASGVIVSALRSAV
jgi:hypothetical protein